ncbi:peptidase m15a [Leptolyngbya sp. Heron Island J]|uniref:D-Ala-D-Ala carboxypeptidase family metallohydrolase n=1 Tax=Leptolyngbya sp. Heron Island J TaxID=1385935 RepID=UPI0003B9CF7E|nr:D-Ala-D-Ala carboxypeptidase family metallohydrolase [Leptolyngbya sp. Heron Island J]ESA35784.1 peptidase m15a [Leptolyngbya sp. Heron Island J]
MAELVPDQRNYYYLLESERAGIHKPILAGLYAVHDAPRLMDGETGLGISAANKIPVDQVNTFPEQVQYAANTLRALTNKLTADGWNGSDLWDGSKGRYSDRFIERIAEGYMPSASEDNAARLESSNAERLLSAYVEDISYDYGAQELPHNLSELDDELLAFSERIGPNYGRLDFQREALLEAARIWRKLDSHQSTIKAMNVAITNDVVDEPALDKALTDFIRQVSRFYSGYPHQREALLRLTQLWRQLDSREEAIDWLRNHDPRAGETNLEIVDPALVAFVQRIPDFYKGDGYHRFALTETYRMWKGLDSRPTALGELGATPQFLAANKDNPAALTQAAKKVDQSLLTFIEGVPNVYKETEEQREALIRLVQIWRKLDRRVDAIQSLFDDVRRMTRANRDSIEAPPAPKPAPLPPRPTRWTPHNIQLSASIIPNGNFTWSEATRGGTRMPPNQSTVDGIVRIAKLAQQARDRIGRPFHITSWYRPADINRQVGGASNSRHIVGDAIDFYVNGLSGDQIYWALDPWWPGGLGRYRSFHRLSHLDARGYRARWRH